MSDESKDNRRGAEDAEKIIEFAPYGWAVYEQHCVNCGHEWVDVAPYLLSDLSRCHNCGKLKDVISPDFSV